MKELNPLLHSQLRLGVMSILMNVEEADYTGRKLNRQPEISVCSLTNFPQPDIYLLKKGL